MRSPAFLKIGRRALAFHIFKNLRLFDKKKKLWQAWSEPVLECGRRARVPGRRTAASLFGVQTNRNRLSLYLPGASETIRLLPQVGYLWQTSSLDLPAGYTASSKKPGIDFFSAACIIKRKLSLKLSQQTHFRGVDMRTKNKAHHPHLQKEVRN